MTLSFAHRAAPATPAGAEGSAAALLAWYDRHRRALAWRAPPGQRAEPYVVWLSEIMLQQTTVAAVGPYFARFLARWPTVEALAAAHLDDVLVAWAGLGYYARARNLHSCARVVATALSGRFPETEAELRGLPGIGADTAAAIAAIAFDRPATVVDGNVERVVARRFGVLAPLPGAKPALRALAATLTPEVRPGDYAQAIMDLGATICTPRRPKCILCPWAAACVARAAGNALELPARAAKGNRPTRRGIAFWVVDGAGAVLLRRRPADGLLGGMMEVPSTGWASVAPSLAQAAREAPVAAEWRLVPGLVRHTFTHFALELAVAVGRVAAGGEQVGAGAVWVPVDGLGDHALPSVMRKVVRHALAHTGAG